MGEQTVAGGKLKEAGTTHWYSPNTGATNETKFTALPGGWRLDDGTFNNIGFFGFFWSSTENSWDLTVQYDNSIAQLDGGSNNKFGKSVRCIKD